MEEGVMYSTELIRRFPEEPQRPILYVVYNEEMIESTQFLIATIRGFPYLKHVTIVPFNKRPNDWRKLDYEMYIDPTVYTYKHSWNN
jgi:hypothetical protein